MAFIQRAHQLSRSGKHPNTLVLQLLDRAWMAQKQGSELCQRRLDMMLFPIDQSGWT